MSTHKSAAYDGDCTCRNRGIRCTGPDGHVNHHAGWDDYGNLIAWSCHCYYDEQKHDDPAAYIANVGSHAEFSS